MAKKQQSVVVSDPAPVPIVDEAAGWKISCCCPMSEGHAVLRKKPYGVVDDEPFRIKSATSGEWIPVKFCPWCGRHVG